MIPKFCRLDKKNKLWTILHSECFGYTQEEFFSISNYTQCELCPYFNGVPIAHISGLPYGIKFVYDGEEISLEGRIIK